MQSAVARYRTGMQQHLRLAVGDDNLLFKYHTQTVERAMETFNAKELIKGTLSNLHKKEEHPVPSKEEAIEEAFTEMIDLNWKKCEAFCREKFDEVEIALRSDDADVMGKNYWSTMKNLSKKYNDKIGEHLHSRMQFLRLEYLNGRQDKDVEIMMKEIQKQANEADANAAAVAAVAAAAADAAAESSGTIDTVSTDDDVGGDATSSGSTTSSGVAEVPEGPILHLSKDEKSPTALNQSKASEQHLEKELLILRMTWGRVMIFWKYWIVCRMETIDLLNNILDNLKDEILQGRTNPVKDFLKWIVSLDGYKNISLRFAHTINKDFSCYKILHKKLTAFLDLVTSSECLKAFGVEPKDLFFNISTFQTNISAKQCEACNGFEMCEKIVGRKHERPGEIGKLLHLKDLLNKLSGEDKLNKDGLKGVIDDLQQEETDMSTMFSESLLAFDEVFTNVNNGTEQLQKDIREWLPKRDESIAKMKEIIGKLNKTTKDVAITQTLSSSVGIAGGVVAIVGLILAPFTAGASLIPTAIAAGVVSGLGAATGIGSAIAEIVIDKDEIKAAMTCIEEDEVIFKKVANQLESSKQNFTMFLRYIPEDELESFIYLMTDPQSTDKRSGPSPIQIAVNVLCFGSFVGKAALMPVTRMAFAGTIAASKAFLAVTHTIAGIGVLLDVANLVHASVKLGKGAKSENAEKLEDLVDQMEKQRGTLLKYLPEMS